MKRDPHWTKTIEVALCRGSHLFCETLWENVLGQSLKVQLEGAAASGRTAPTVSCRQIGRTGTKRSTQRQGTEGLTHHFYTERLQRTRKHRRRIVVLSLLPLCSIRWPRWQLADKRSRDNTLAHYNDMCVPHVFKTLFAFSALLRGSNTDLLVVQQVQGQANSDKIYTQYWPNQRTAKATMPLIVAHWPNMKNI